MIRNGFGASGLEGDVEGDVGEGQDRKTISQRVEIQQGQGTSGRSTRRDTSGGVCDSMSSSSQWVHFLCSPVLSYFP